VVLVALSAIADLLPARDGAGDLLRKAKKAEKAGRVAQAYLLYAEAAALDPAGQTRAWAKSLALRRRALTEIKAMPKDLDRGDEEAGSSALLGVISPEELARRLYEQVAGAYGLTVVFDGDYTTSKLIRLKIEDAGYREALRILGAATGTFAVPVSERLILVAQDTTRKRQELEHNMAVVIPIPETVSVQEAQELARAIQQLMEIKRLVIDTQRRLVLVRDRVSRVLPAQVLFAELMRPRPEVTIEVDFLEATETAKTRYGLGLPWRTPARERCSPPNCGRSMASRRSCMSATSILSRPRVISARSKEKGKCSLRRRPLVSRISGSSSRSPRTSTANRGSPWRSRRS